MNIEKYVNEMANYIISQPEDVEKHFIQYCNKEAFNPTVLFYRYMLKQLSRNKTYLNIGTGSGYFEFLANQDKFKIDTCDCPTLNSEKIFNFSRQLLGIEKNYECSNFRDDMYEIKDCVNTYDAILFLRYVPFMKDDDMLVEPKVKSVFGYLTKFSDTIIVSILTTHNKFYAILDEIGLKYELSDNLITIDISSLK